MYRLSRSPPSTYGPTKAQAFLLCAVLLAGAAGQANASSAATTFQVTATVVKACTISTPSTLSFGAYDPNASSPLAVATNFNVECTSGTTYSVGLNAGVGTGSTLANRVMTSPSAASGSNTLSYGLFKDASHTTAWDNSVSASGYTGNGTVQPFAIYGRIPTNQYSSAPASDYADTITMTLSY